MKDTGSRTQFVSFVFSIICILSSVSCLFLPGCGYSTRSNLPSSLRMIYVEPFENKIAYTTEIQRNIYLPLLEVKVKNAIVDRFQFDGSLKISSQDKADLILKGALTYYERDALRDNENEDVLEYRVKVFVSLEMWDTANQKVWWEEPSFVGEATYYTSGARAKSEDSAIQASLEDLGRRVVERTLADW